MVLLEHADGLFSYALALTRNVHEAEDLVQETYLRAIQGMERLREDGNAKAWLYAILRNIRFNQIRQRHTRPRLLELDADEKFAELIAETDKDPLALYVSKVEKQQIHEALEQLSEEFREIILLREFAELSYQEIAALLGCAQGTVMSRLARARQKLRTLLSPHRTVRADDKPFRGTVDCEALICHGPILSPCLSRNSEGRLPAQHYEVHPNLLAFHPSLPCRTS